MGTRIVILLVLLLLGFQSRLEAQPLFITEFMAARQTTWLNTKGDYSDWVEVYNASTNEVSLGQWFITDRPETWTRRRLPDIVLGPNRFFAFDPGFGLNNSGDYLAISNPLTGDYHQVGRFPEQHPEIAYGFPVLGGVVLTNRPTYMIPSPGRAKAAPSPPYPLVLTEIMYQPISTAAGFQPDEHLQFVELKNVGAEPLDLTGCAFISGIKFAFSNVVLTPGEHVLVVTNRLAFQLRYGTSPRIAGEFSGSLKNGGEQILLRGPNGEAIVNMVYDQNWHPLADGLGFSLVLRDESVIPADYNRASTWRNSSQPGGSPGRADPPSGIAPVVVNEILAHAEPPYEDAIELANLDTNAVDVSGWYLTDNSNAPFKFRIPEGAPLIPGGGFLAFDEHSFNSFENRSQPTAFSFNGRGEEVWLFSADRAGNLTGYAHGFIFGASDTNVTLGRIVTSTGDEHLVPQKAMTLYESNAPPAFGPLVISEILYADSPGLEGIRYVEIHNITGEPVPLYDPLFQSVRWRLSNAVNYSFPDAIIPPFGYAIVTGPIQPDTLARFRSSIPGDVQIFGPWTSIQGPVGLDLYLLRPDAPKLDTNSMANSSDYLVVDQVPYPPLAPWLAAASGMGASVSRINDEAFGMDPVNWHAALPNPGRDLPRGTNPVILTHPTSVTGATQALATLAVTAAGDPPLLHHWLRNGVASVGPLSSNIVVQPFEWFGAGLFTCAVIDRFGAVFSSNAIVNSRQFPLHDTSPPSLKILSPQSSSVIVTERTLVFSGEALDDVSLAAVLFQKDNGPLTLASGETHWTFTVSLSKEHTLIHVMALDLAGNVSQTNTVAVRWATANEVVFLSVNGSGTIRGLTNHQILIPGQTYGIEAIPSPGQLFVQWTDGEGNLVSTESSLSIVAGQPWVLTAHFARDPNRIPATLLVQGDGRIVGPTNGQILKVGRRYTVEARPSAGNLFLNWTDATGTVLSIHPTLSYVARDDLEVTANFVPESHFLDVQGGYTALFFAPSLPDHQRAGSVKFDVSRTGRYSGVVKTGGRRMTFTGAFDAALASRLVLNPGTERETTLKLQLRRDTPALTGAVSNALVQASLTGGRTMPQGSEAGGPWSGTHFLQIVGDNVADDVDNLLPPIPFRPLALTIQPDGRFTLNGILPGGARVARRGTMTIPGTLAIHEPLYSGNGSLLGWIGFTPGVPASAAGSLLWSHIPPNTNYSFNFWLTLAVAPGAAPPAGPPPVIVQHPQGATVVGTQSASFHVNAAGTPPLRYQWHLDGRALVGKTGPSLVVTNATLADAGAYQCLVVNAGGIATSSAATLNVWWPANILDHPADQSVLVRPEPTAAAQTNATFSVTATTASPPLSFQWWVRYLSNSAAIPVPIPGATLPTLTVTNVTTNSYGAYFCAVTDTSGTVFSSNATLYPLILPTMVRPPRSLSGPPGTPVNLSVEYAGFPPPFTVEWRMAGIGPVATNLNDQTVDILTVLTPDEAGGFDLYRVIVRNRANSLSGVWSYPWTLVSAVADIDGDGIPEGLEGAPELDELDVSVMNLDFDDNEVRPRPEP